jgi:molecular chaperone IbpA
MNNLALWGPGFKEFDRYFVGFDNKLNRMIRTGSDLAKSAIQNYPPYNISKVEENQYVIEIAVAGFNENDISIDIADGKLVVRGSVKTETKETDTFLFRGIANRAFTRSFVLDDYIEVKSAEIDNGMLTIALERIVPDHLKPQKIEIKRKDVPQLLNE